MLDHCSGLKAKYHLDRHCQHVPGHADILIISYPLSEYHFIGQGIAQLTGFSAMFHNAKENIGLFVRVLYQPTF